MNILWHSHRPSTNSMYGRLTRTFVSALTHTEHRVTISTPNAHETGYPYNPSGVLELPGTDSCDSNDIIQPHMCFSKAQVLLSLVDPDGLDPLVWNSLPWAVWLPVNSPLVDQEASILHQARWIIAMSRYDEQRLYAAGFQPFYVPPAIDPDIYRLVDRTSARLEMSQFVERDMQDQFLVMSSLTAESNFVNQLDKVLKIFVQVTQIHPNSALYLHPESDSCWDSELILGIAQRCGLADKVILPPSDPFISGLVTSTLANQLYNSADVFLQLKRRAAVLIPLEAQCAGCPVVAVDPGSDIELYAMAWESVSLEIAPAALSTVFRLGCNGRNRALRRTAREKARLYEIDRVMAFCLLPALALMGRASSLSPPMQRTLDSGKELMPREVFV